LDRPSYEEKRGELINRCDGRVSCSVWKSETNTCERVKQTRVKISKSDLCTSVVRPNNCVLPESLMDEMDP